MSNVQVTTVSVLFWLLSYHHKHHGIDSFWLLYGFSLHFVSLLNSYNRVICAWYSLCWPCKLLISISSCSQQDVSVSRPHEMQIQLMHSFGVWRVFPVLRLRSSGACSEWNRKGGRQFCTSVQNFSQRFISIILCKLF